MSNSPTAKTGSTRRSSASIRRPLDYAAREQYGGGWLRFPLALLAYEPDDPINTMSAILYYCIWEVGGSDKAEALMDQEAMALAEDRNINADEDPDHLRLVRGAQLLNVSNGDCEHMLAVLSRVRSYLAKEGPAARNQVNISKEWFWRAILTARHNDGCCPLSWREFRFLCAVLSKIGTKGFARCGWQEIQARAADWCGKAAMHNAGPAVQL